jgi:TrpR-related protein YerC/YecD
MIKLNKRQLTEDVDEVLMALVYIDNLKNMQNFADDIFTTRELETIAMRWKAVRMLRAGIVYTKIVDATGMSSATVARLAKLMNRRVGGFNAMLEQMGA